MTDGTFDDESYGNARATKPASEVDRISIEFERDELRSQQNFVSGVLAGVAGAAIGAILWAAITVMTGFQIGFMAIGIGVLVGYCVRTAGNGIDPIFGVVGAVLSLVGCGVGNLLTVIGFVAQDAGLGILTVLPQLDMGVTLELMAATFSPIDLLFYGIAVYEGYKLSFRQLDDDVLESSVSDQATA